MDATYKLSTWHDMPQYRCLMCPWDTVEADGEAQMKQHFIARHPGLDPVLDMPKPEPEAEVSAGSFARSMREQTGLAPADDEENTS